MTRRVKGGVECRLSLLCVETPGGLCCLLSLACPRLRPQIYDLSHETRDNWEIARSEIVLNTQLGAGNFGEVWQGKTYVLCENAFSVAQWLSG